MHAVRIAAISTIAVVLTMLTTRHGFMRFCCLIAMSAGPHTQHGQEFRIANTTAMQVTPKHERTTLNSAIYPGSVHEIVTNNRAVCIPTQQHACHYPLQHIYNRCGWSHKHLLAHCLRNTTSNKRCCCFLQGLVIPV